MLLIFAQTQTRLLESTQNLKLFKKNKIIAVKEEPKRTLNFNDCNLLRYEHDIMSIMKIILIRKTSLLLISPNYKISE